MSYSTKALLRFHLLVASLVLSAAPALAQGQKLPVDLTLPPASVIGRPSNIGPGQATAIPFAQLAAQLSQFGLLTNPLTFAEFPSIGANTLIGSVAGGTPLALSSTQVTALINAATSSLSGALPAWPNNTTTFFRGDGTYATLNVGAIGGFGTGVATALGNNIGSAGAPVTYGGALGTPSSGTGTNLTGIPISTGISGLGTGVATALGVNTGTAGSHVVSGGALGTPSSGTVGAGVTIGGVTMGLGSDATGDVYYNNGGVLTRLPKGSNGQVLELVSGVPAWASASGTGTVTAIVAGTATVSGTCTSSCATVSYSQGSWTPAITTTGTVGTPAYSIQVGSYEQVGRSVIARFTIVLSGWTGSPTGSIEISGLPVASSSNSNDYAGCYMDAYTITGTAGQIGMVGQIGPGSSTIIVLMNAQSGTVNLIPGSSGPTPTIIGACVYHT